MSGPVRILLVDDHPIVRRGIASCLARHAHLAVVGEAADGLEALEKARELGPEIVLMDIDMPRMTGLAATEALRRQMPEIKVLILTIHNHPEYVLRIIEAGAKGYVLKDAAPEELVKAIEAVHAGQTFFSPEIARVAIHRLMHQKAPAGAASELTPREREVLVQIAEGLSNKEIAAALNVGVRTIETHRERIMRKLNIHTIAGLTKYAISKKLISLREV